jgi:broad specificity phosphatase PhoE
MELIFIRHGQGVHNTDVPARLNIENPRLTDQGRIQVDQLSTILACRDEDLFIVSPTIRTIETANIITKHLLKPRKYINPLVGPRMFPLPKNPQAFLCRCDKSYPMDIVVRDHPDFILMLQENDDLWNEGINTMDASAFKRLGIEMIDWIKAQNTSRAFIITHDGTITDYRILLGEKGLTREDFLGEAGWHRVIL